MLEFSNPIADEDSDAIIDYKKDTDDWNKYTKIIGKICLIFLCCDFIAILIFIILYRNDL